MSNFYNEIDHLTAEWIRQLIQAQEIPPGTVDERDIRDITPNELRSFRQCHFFAGIAVWPYAFVRAGWDYARPVWSGSCPCQPFSASGKRGGFDDERHLWPFWAYLINECRPTEIVGEQVASKDGYAWLDLVQSDLEGMGYACGAVVSPSAGYGAPHERHRQYFGAKTVGVAHGSRSQGWSGMPERADQFTIGSGSVVGELADAELEQRSRSTSGHNHKGRRDEEPSAFAGRDGVSIMADNECFGRIGRRTGETSNEPGTIERSDGLRTVSALADTERYGRKEIVLGPGGSGLGGQENHERSQSGSGYGGKIIPPGPVNGFWRDSDWISCRDERWRPIEPGTFPLAHGAAARVGRLRGYGNAINAEQAIAFVEAFGST